MNMSDEIDVIAEALRVNVGLLVRRLRQGDPDDLSPGARSALAKLDRGGPATSAALARQEQISPQSMGAILSMLESRSLIERNRDPQDGRRMLVAITKLGRQRLKDKRDARTEQLAAALSAGFSPAELKKLHAAVPLLERLAGQL